MTALGVAITEAVVLNEGRRGFLRRLADPFWFQAFGAVLGMDWHSSGITTSVLGALKRGLGPRAHELGLHVCGGRGKHSRRTPAELFAVGERTGLDGAELARLSRLTAKVDNVAVQDGFALYLHSFVVTDDGDWVVVQQGMNGAVGQARRYHWRSTAVDSFVVEPHAAMVGPSQGTIVNLTDRRSAAARTATLELVGDGPDRAVEELRRVADPGRHLQLPAHHEVRPSDLFLRRLHGVLELAGEQGAADFEQLLLTRGLGPRTMQALALVAEVVCGAPSRFDDPARFSFAHGGKDGHPHPVPCKVYDESIAGLRHALDAARVGRREKIDAFRRLEARVRRLEGGATGPDLDAIIDAEWDASPGRGGMTVLGPPSDDVRRRVRGERRGRRRESRQLDLFG
jgi:hypothetical protein